MIILETRDDLIKTLNNDLIVCEIGVFQGEFSKFIYKNIKPKELHLVDIFEGKMCSGDKDGNNMIWTDLEQEHVKLQEFFSKDKNVFFHKGYSYNILNTFLDDYFDMVYVDGDHSYEGVKKDLEILFTKVKNNGIICGHDYTEHRFPGVVKAVNEFCLEKNQEISYLTKDGCPTFMINLKK